MLNLQKPLAIFDLETTGINITKDKIVEIAILKIMPDGSKKNYHSLVNPLMPIPEATSAIHGIKDADVANAPSFKDIANTIKQFIDNCDLGGYNSNRFDIPILTEEFHNVGIDINLKDRLMVDVAQIFMKMEKRTLEAAYKFYCNKALDNAHSAEADVNATYEVLMAQIAYYPNELQNDIAFLHTLSKGEDFADFSRRIKLVNDTPVFNFGKYKDQSVAEIFKREPQYYDWMMRGDFAKDTKQVISDIFNKTILKSN
jgi:DNA polymerase III subunit epsilon